MNAIDIKNLSKTYDNKVLALDNINLSVEQGDFFAMLGPNGAGKSTTIGIIVSLITKSCGEVKIFGHDIEKEPTQARSYIGLVPQEFNFNVFDKVINILVRQAGYYGIPKKLALERAEFYLKQLDLWEKRNVAPRLLSGGMKRRLMIARALVHEPQLLMLDEPTAGVDIELRRSIWAFLQKLNQQGTTIILTTHYLEEAEHLCKNLAIIDHGKIVEHSSIKSLLEKLNVETFVLDLKSPIDKLPDLTPFTARHIDNMTIEVDVTKTQALNQLFALLSQQNIEILSLRNKVNRLEELFLRTIQKKEE